MFAFMIDLQAVGAGDVDAQVVAPTPNLAGSFLSWVPVSDLQVQAGPPPAWQSDLPSDPWWEKTGLDKFHFGIPDFLFTMLI